MKSLSELAIDHRHAAAADFLSMARSLLLCRGVGATMHEAARNAEAIRASDRVQRIMKTAVSAGTMTGDAAALGDLHTVSSGFVASLANIGVFDRMLADGALIRVPLETPLVNISSRIQGHIVGEGQAKPISRITLTQGGLPRGKASSIIVVSTELANDMSGAASALIARELRKGVAAATDQQFLAAIMSGVTPITASGDIYTDLAAMLTAMELDATSRLYLVVDPATLKRLAARGSAIAGFEFPELKLNPLGGSIGGMPVLPSDQVPVIGSPGTGIMLIDATGIAGDSAVVSLDRASQTSLQMDDAPTQASGGTGSPEMSGGSTMVSLFQTNSVALRAERYFGAQRLRTDAVQILSGATW